MSFEICQITAKDDRIVSAPRLICDVCRQPIERLERGIFQWDIDFEDPAILGPVQKTRIVHYDCEDALGGYHQFPFSQEIDTGLVYWLIASGLFDSRGRPTQAWREAWEKARCLGALA